MKPRRLQWSRRCAALAAAALLLAMAARGQEAVRMSLASAEAAEVRRRTASTIGYYNLKLGPTAWNFGAGLGVDYNSNVNYTESNPEGDVIFRPQINTRMLWPVSEQNSINLALGAGYSLYVEHPDLDRLYILPGTELSFDLYAGEFWINLHDRISITEYSYQNPAVTGTGDYSQLQNTLGLTTVWDLNKGIARLGYDHVNYDTISGGTTGTFGGQPSGYSEVFSASTGYYFEPGTLLGLEVGGSLITYTTPTINTPYSNANQWNVGGFCDTPVSEYIHLTGHAGYTVYSPESAAAGIPITPTSGVYAQLDFRHRVNQHMDYSLSGGRTIGVAYWGDTLDRYFARWQANWRILHKVTLSSSFGFEHGTEIYGPDQIYDQYGAGVTLSRFLTDKLSGSLGYQFYVRDSDQPGQSYSVSIVSLNLSYRF